jgi:FtsH-binding integral membrane protein
MKRKFLPLFIVGVAIILAVVAAILPFSNGIDKTSSLTVLGATTTSVDYIKGFWLIFGYSNSSGGVSYDQVIGLLIAWVLIIAAAVFFAVGALAMLATQENSKMGEVLIAFGGLLAIAAGVLFFCAIPLGGFENQSAGGNNLGAAVVYSLDIGFLLPGIFGVAGGVLSFIPLTLANRN